MLGSKNVTSARILKEIESLSKQLAELRGRYDAAKQTHKTESELIELQKKLTALQIEYDREQEKHAREKREVEHMVGLEKKRQTFEIESATTTAKLTVREENLEADRKRFEEQMKFQTKRFEDEVGYLKDMVGQVLDRLPTVTVDKQIKAASRK